MATPEAMHPQLGKGNNKLEKVGRVMQGLGTDFLVAQHREQEGATPMACRDLTAGTPWSGRPSCAAHVTLRGSCGASQGGLAGCVKASRSTSD